MKVLCHCRKCESLREFEFSPEKPPTACNCGALALPYATDAFLKEAMLNQCPLCGSAHLYRQKDFNRNVGVALIVVGVVLSYWTYGISLLVVTLFDWWLLRRVKELGVCYQCQGQFRSSPTIEKLPTFNLSLHDYYKNLKTALNLR